MRATAVFLALFSLLAGAAAADAPAPARGQAAMPILGVVLPDFAALVRSQGPVVVNIRVFRTPPADPVRESGKSAAAPLQETGLGSGFVVAPNGVILTNRHVILDADKITVRFADKHELPARVLGVDPLTDVAVLKVEAQGLATATLGDYAEFLCPWCCENIGTAVDLTAGSRRLIEDCQVCCHPFELSIEVDTAGTLRSVTVQRVD